MNYQTKDSGKRKEFSSGMARDAESGKPRFELLVLNDTPYEEQMLTRFAALLSRGAEKYEERNFEKAETQEELNRFKESAFRHFMQWISNEDDEDHAAATWFNIMGAEMVKYKMRNKPSKKTPQEEYQPLDRKGEIIREGDILEYDPSECGFAELVGLRYRVFKNSADGLYLWGVVNKDKTEQGSILLKDGKNQLWLNIST